MTLKLFWMIITCVTLSALAQMVMKIGMSASQVQTVLAHGSYTEIISTIVLNLYVILGLGMYIAGAGLWLLVLSRADLSLAYPFVGLGFILTMLLGWAVLQESIGLSRLLGTLFVTVGVVLISKS
jgi:multidrug transporter EmrE-like cation transporter